MTDSVTRSYIEECLAGNTGLLNAMTDARFPASYRSDYGRKLLSRPFFAGRTEVLRCAEDLASLFRVMTSLPDRLFGGDISQYCDATGMSPAEATLMTRFRDPPVLYGRADLYHDGRSLRLLEYNLSSALGGTDRSEVCRCLLELDAFRAFAERHRLGYTHTGERLVAALRQAALPVTRGREPVVGLIESDGALSKYIDAARQFQEMMGQLGITVLLGEASQLGTRSGRVLLDGHPIDVAMRYFAVGDLLTSSTAAAAADIVTRAQEDGTAVLWTGLRSHLADTKSCLALLSDERWRGAFSAAERELIDRILPWTRRLAKTATQIGGQSTDLIDYCRAEQRELVLKPSAGYAGRGVVTGWTVSEREWRDALTTGCQESYVVQRRVIPRREPIVHPETRELADWIAVWGTFLLPDGYAGSFVRAAPANGQAVINIGTQEAVRSTSVFHFPESPEKVYSHIVED